MTTQKVQPTTHCAPTTPHLARCISVLPNDYSQIENKPQINGVVLTGNKSAKEIGLLSIQPKDYEAVSLTKASQRSGFLLVIAKDQEPMKLSVDRIINRGTGFFTSEEIDPSVSIGVYQFVQKK